MEIMQHMRAGLIVAIAATSKALRTTIRDTAACLRSNHAASTAMRRTIARIESQASGGDLRAILRRHLLNDLRADLDQLHGEEKGYARELEALSRAHETLLTTTRRLRVAMALARGTSGPAS